MDASLRYAPFSMTRAKMSFRTPVRNPVRCGCFTSLRFVQQDKLEMANLTLLSLALQKERDVCASRQGEVNPASGCFAPFSMTRAKMSFRTQ